MIQDNNKRRNSRSNNDNLDREPLDATPPLAGRVYGNIVYWGTFASAILVIFGSVMSFVSGRHYVDPAYMLSSIWQQHSVSRIWQEAVGHLPQGHWYLDHLGTGDGITELGLALGVFVVIPAIIGSALVLFKERNIVFGTFALIAALITTISMVGLLPLPIG